MSVTYDIENLRKVATEAIEHARDPERFAALGKLLEECGVPENAHVGALSAVFEGNRKVQIEWAAAQAYETLKRALNEDPFVRMVAINSVANVLDALKGVGEWPPKDAPKPPPIGEPPLWLQHELRFHKYRHETANASGRLAEHVEALIALCEELIRENEQLRRKLEGAT